MLKRASRLCAIMPPAEPPIEPYGKGDFEYPLARGLFGLRFWVGTGVAIILDLILWAGSIQDHNAIPWAAGVLVLVIGLFLFRRLAIRRRWA